MADAPYRPIDCAIHDRLEDLAVRRVRQRLLLRDEDGTEREVSAAVVDVFARDGAEFVRLSDGEVVRLDRVLAIGADPVGGSC